VASDTGRGKPTIERGVVLFPLFYHPVGEGIPAAHRAGATIGDVLDLIKRDAPAALTDWLENKSGLLDGRSYDDGYSAGYREGYSDSYEMR
jgi:hypothetical protein